MRSHSHKDGTGNYEICIGDKAIVVRPDGTAYDKTTGEVIERDGGPQHHVAAKIMMRHLERRRKGGA